MRIDIPPEGIEYYDADGTLVMAIKPGGAEGTGTCSVFIHNGEIDNIRNIQGGVQDGNSPDDINLDIGAGGDGVTGPRGWVGTCPDVGKGLLVGSGRNRLLAKFAGNDLPAKDLIDLYAPVHLHGPLMVYDPVAKTWVRKL